MVLVRKISVEAQLTGNRRASEMGQGMASSSVDAEISKMTRERYHGALLGLAAGDALGTTLEFKPPGTFPPLADMIGGGQFHLGPGEWTDDTSMALCLAESLIEKRGFDAKDQMDRFRHFPGTS
jgi:ADP-ribosylglycohydrolase